MLLPVKVSTKKNSSSLAGRRNGFSSFPVMTADASVRQMSSDGLRRFSAVSLSVYSKMVLWRSISFRRLSQASGDRAFRIRSKESKICGRFFSSMPMLDRHPEVVLSGHCSKPSETGCELAPGKRPVASQVGKQIIRKTIYNIISDIFTVTAVIASLDSLECRTTTALIFNI